MTARGSRCALWRNGLGTLEAVAKQMLDGGGGLSDAEQDRWFSFVNRVREAATVRRPGALSQFRQMIEAFERRGT
jgi:hypothetical protein